mgnify:CR=1 FL=1
MQEKMLDPRVLDQINPELKEIEKPNQPYDELYEKNDLFAHQSEVIVIAYQDELLSKLFLDQATLKRLSKGGAERFPYNYENGLYEVTEEQLHTMIATYERENPMEKVRVEYRSLIEKKINNIDGMEKDKELKSMLQESNKKVEEDINKINKI